ncbi:hypothetical protein SAMN05216349_12048 [Oribacterium sp. KHPX15]|nr:hypothetical protein SAMN05216349_12048 [Oribacterium sp. KHPX15]
MNNLGIIADNYELKLNALAESREQRAESREQSRG